jgi:hypothetical protein
MMWTPSFQQLTVGCAVLGAIIALIQHRKGDGLRLETVVAKLLAASSVPTGFFLLACAFNTSLVSRLADLGLYLAAAGIALLYVSIKEFIKG